MKMAHCAPVESTLKVCMQRARWHGSLWAAAGKSTSSCDGELPAQRPCTANLCTAGGASSFVATCSALKYVHRPGWAAESQRWLAGHSASTPTHYQPVLATTAPVAVSQEARPGRAACARTPGARPLPHFSTRRASVVRPKRPMMAGKGSPQAPSPLRVTISKWPSTHPTGVRSGHAAVYSNDCRWARRAGGGSGGGAWAGWWGHTGGPWCVLAGAPVSSKACVQSMSAAWAWPAGARRGQPASAHLPRLQHRPLARHAGAPAQTKRGSSGVWAELGARVREQGALGDQAAVAVSQKFRKKPNN